MFINSVDQQNGKLSLPIQGEPMVKFLIKSLSNLADLKIWLVPVSITYDRLLEIEMKAGQGPFKLSDLRRARRQQLGKTFIQF